MNLKGVDNDLIQKMNKQFNVSNNYTDAMKLTQNMLDKINSGKTQYTDQYNNLMNAYNSKDKFKYDMNTDTLFQNALASAVGQGKEAMQNTIGQASALTGGYANSYATSAANQAYNASVKGAYDNLPSYYQIAQEAYNAEDQRQLNQLNLVKNADETEYARNKDAYTANKEKADTLYNQEFSKWQADVSQATDNAKMQNTDWWNNTNYNEQVNQYNSNLAFEKQKNEEANALQREQFSQNYQLEQQKLAQEQKNWEKEYQMSLRKLANDEANDSFSRSMSSKEYNLKASQSASNEKAPNLYTYSGTSKGNSTFYDSTGKKKTVQKGYSPYTGTKNGDIKNGVFSNGYQPDNISGKKLSDSGLPEQNVNGRMQTVWKTKDGKKYLWDGYTNRYVDVSSNF